MRRLKGVLLIPEGTPSLIVRYGLLDSLHRCLKSKALLLILHLKIRKYKMEQQM
ncbi:hypothetical protein HanIR_Chr13g0668411 [Helianthus annuus]|nr:hypothetical protein HanIR_Chr13g0668411 [Helianthus annuus]